MSGAVALGAIPQARADDAEVHAKASQEARGEEAFKKALARLNSTSANERAAAADELGRRGIRFRIQIADVLRPLLLKDSDAAVRAASARALGRLGARESIPELTQALADENAEVRSVAAAALWRMPDPKAVPALLDRTRDRDPKVREWSALALGATGDTRAVPALAHLLRDSERTVRLASVRSLGHIDRQDALGALEGYLDSGNRDEEEKDEVVNAIASAPGSDRVAALLALYAAAASDVGQKKRLLSALAKIGDAQALPMLRKVSSEKPDSRGLRAPAAAAYAAVLARTNEAARPPSDTPSTTKR
ncbi:MAG TPA: HEAT repeat domain-containing protein [Polyangiales bacterium]